MVVVPDTPITTERPVGYVESGAVIVPYNIELAPSIVTGCESVSILPAAYEASLS